ncbi:type II secretion system protein GspM [uncultured Algimonas sp.]|uniref:type II secretion system protein GspM n=1 Tax=uncultured Algimonas sp. TaxID=1547920 RepID=UPI00261D68E3|nr:type II secretion system protein GspM [uncultured Algimonas sp.]
MMSGLPNWWMAREPREQLLLGILAGLAAVFLLVFILILPVQAAGTSARADFDRAKSDLALVSRLPQTGSGSASRAPFDRAALVAVANAQSVKLTQVQPSGDGAFSVWIDDAETRRLYGFFETLLGDYAATLERVVVSADANGRLSAQFTVR